MNERMVDKLEERKEEIENKLKYSDSGIHPDILKAVV